MRKYEVVNRKELSRKQEKTLASALGWEVVSGSGSRFLHPGDIKSNQWLGECKTHITKYNRIKFIYSVWDKILDEAVSVRKFPVLFVDDGSQKTSTTWCITNQLPSKPYKIFTFPFNVNNSSFSFNHEDLIELTRKSEREFGDMVIYVVKRKNKQDIYLYPFTSFLDCFGD